MSYVFAGKICHPLFPDELPDEIFPMRARKNTRYTTAGVNYSLSIWDKHGLTVVRFIDRRGRLRTRWYHNKDEFNEEWE